ncbi:MAG: prepilin-type N-terminal cleavage/methylation domain-containing protein [Methyloglobulus sp.]|nr:prepilin-type N-terminal cleavage/methylation domain-containing protein [Methyloglobulus sp.]
MKNSLSIQKQLQKGFTLVELLIVVIILAILAAIVVPQFASTTDDAKVSSLDSTLSNMRSAIALYRQQHTAYPGNLISSGGVAACTTAGGVLGTGTTANTETAFLDQLAYYSNSAGKTCTARGAGNEFPLGPYIQKREIPKNPITDSNVLAPFSTAGVLGLTTLTAGGGWKYDSVSGQFIADDTNKGYNTH